MMWESSTKTRGSAGLVGGRTVTISTLEVTARGVLQGGSPAVMGTRSQRGEQRAAPLTWAGAG